MECLLQVVQVEGWDKLLFILWPVMVDCFVAIAIWGLRCGEVVRNWDWILGLLNTCSGFGILWVSVCGKACFGRLGCKHGREVLLGDVALQSGRLTVPKILKTSCWPSVSLDSSRLQGKSFNTPGSTSGRTRPAFTKYCGRAARSDICQLSAELRYDRFQTDAGTR